MKVVGETTIFKNDFGYSTSISTKNMDGSYDKLYLSVSFKRGDERVNAIENMTKIDIKNSFLSFYKSTNGMPKIRIVVLDFDIVEGEKPIQKNNDGDVFSSGIVSDADDFELPF